MMIPPSPRVPLLLAALALGACKSDSGDDSAADDSVTDDTAPPATYQLSGQAVTFGRTPGPAAEGLCVDAVDPANVLDGGLAEVLASTQTGPDGEYTLTDVAIRTQPTVVVIYDCPSATTPTVFPTGSPVPATLDGVENGAVLTGVRSISIGLEALGGLSAALAQAGSTVDVSTAGMLMGVIWDGAEQPIEGATITCASCTVYYGDSDPTDGLFSTAGTPNTATSAEALWVIPGAPRGVYSAAAGGYTFRSIEMAAPPGGAFFGAAIGTPE